MVKKRVESEILKKLNKINKKVENIEQVERKNIRQEIKLENEQEKIEKAILKLGRFTFKREHFLEIVRGTAGAFLGVGLGMNLLNLKSLATSLPWINVFGILVFILIISSLLIYKNQKDFIKEEGKKVVFKKLIFLYLIVILVELIALTLFGGIPDEQLVLIKMLIIGSYSAMAGAVSFSIV